MVGNGSRPTTPNRKVFIMSKVTTYQDLLDNDHAALMAECEAIQAQRKANRRPRRKYAQRSEADLLREYANTLAATSLNMINYRNTPWS